MDLEIFARISRCNAEIASLQALIESYKVANLIRELNNEAPAYGEKDFSYIVTQIDNIIYDLKSLSGE